MPQLLHMRKDAMKVCVGVRIEKDIGAVWQAWNNPDSVMEWHAASDDWYVTASQVELKIGGGFCHRMAAKDGSVSFDFTGTFVAIEAPNLLGYCMPDGRSVTVGFVSNLGTTYVTEILDAESATSYEQQRDGWQNILNNFKRHMEKQIKLAD
ncbi:hypothetical protein D3C85_460590 [compost metagenome]